MFGGLDCARTEGSFAVDPTIMPEEMMTTRLSERLGETPGTGEKEVAASIGNKAKECVTDARDGKPIGACPEFDAVGGLFAGRCA
ncbi:hypothetical protein [Peteryoungia ipomoeae]|uniref:hypothetical protein n=1 Tax=Peteryoungia ipomoeae TaxID=1210932 RepID=UPI00319DEC9D